MSEIIRPEGNELLQYLNGGHAICNECGAVMKRTNDPNGGCDIYICPSCGLKIDEMDYEYKHNDEAEWFGMDQEDVPPSGCRACGGPYPYCKTSCKLFDE